MAQEISATHPLCRFFRGLTEYTFQAELGIADPRLIDYVSDLLARFVPAAGPLVLEPGAWEATTLTGLLAEATAATNDEQRHQCFRSAGDIALFWTGVFPEVLGRMRLKNSPDLVLDVRIQGKRSYHLASRFADLHDEALLQRLSQEFDVCALGLAKVRSEWEQMPPVQALWSA